jgi:hypothetical protein
MDNYYSMGGCGTVKASYHQFASELELLSEIHFSNMLIFENFFRRAFRNQAAITQYIGVPADTERFAHIMVSNQDANATFAKVSDDALDIQHRDRVNTREWFVKQDEQRIGGQRSRDFHATAFAAGKTDTEAGTDVPDMQFVEQVFEFLFPAGTVKIVTVLEDSEDVLLDCQFAKYRGFLRQVPEPELGAPVHRLGREVFSVKQYLAAIGRYESDNHVERGRFAGTVRPKQTNYLAALDFEGNAFDDFAKLEALGNVVDAENAH